jgi:hypothetical protein
MQQAQRNIEGKTMMVALLTTQGHAFLAPTFSKMKGI